MQGNPIAQICGVLDTTCNSGGDTFWMLCRFFHFVDGHVLLRCAAALDVVARRIHLPRYAVRHEGFSYVRQRIVSRLVGIRFARSFCALPIPHITAVGVFEVILGREYVGDEQQREPVRQWRVRVGIVKIPAAPVSKTPDVQQRGWDEAWHGNRIVRPVVDHRRNTVSIPCRFRLKRAPLRP